MAKVLGIHAFDADRAAQLMKTHSHGPSHLDSNVTTVTFSRRGTVNRLAVKNWLQDLLWENTVAGSPVSFRRWMGGED